MNSTDQRTYSHSSLGESKFAAFIGTSDSERAKHFYSGILGLTFKADDGFALVLMPEEPLCA